MSDSLQSLSHELRNIACALALGAEAACLTTDSLHALALQVSDCADRAKRLEAAEVSP